MLSSSLRPALVSLALGLSFVASVAGGCGDGTSTTSGATGGSGGSGTSSSSTGTPVVWDTKCHDCLQTRCKAELDACDAECVAIQACIDTVCGHLSQLGAATEEGQCQVQCQSKHPGAKAAHLAVVNCAQGAMGTSSADTCMPPCSFAIYDWEQCADAQAKGTCKAALDACSNSADCQTYQACASACSTNADCQACAGTPGAKAGQRIYEAYWNCVEDQCLAEAWLPQF
ncbi:MAG: hypothetical protein QM820_44445 [Minicystis sp.]